MAIVANTFTTFDSNSLKEQLSETIANISPEETPIQSNIGSETARGTFIEWQKDSLAATDTTAIISGDDVSSFDAVTPTARVGNYMQIRRRTIIVADNLASVDAAGKNDELAYQVAMRGKELKRDIEAVIASNQARASGSAGVASATAGLGSWIATNAVKAADGANPTGDGTDARTDGTQAAFTEDMLKDAMSAAWTAGGTPSLLLVGAFNKRAVSGFAGIAQQRYQAPSDGPTTIVGAADVYLSDFGTLSVVPSRFQRDRDAFLIDPEYAAVSYLRPIQKIDLAKTGDASKSMLLAEFALKVHNEAAHAGVFDLTTA